MNHLSTSQLVLSAEIQNRQLRNPRQNSDRPQEPQNKVAMLNKRSSIRKLFSVIVNPWRKQQVATSGVPSLNNQ